MFVSVLSLQIFAVFAGGYFGFLYNVEAVGDYEAKQRSLAVAAVQYAARKNYLPAEQW